jgi:hypothetical protein
MGLSRLSSNAAGLTEDGVELFGSGLITLIAGNGSPWGGICDISKRI